MDCDGASLYAPLQSRVGMEQALVEHPHAKSSWITIRILRDRDMQTVLVVETDLVLNADNPNYDVRMR